MKKIGLLVVLFIFLVGFSSSSAFAGVKGRLNTLIILDSIGLADRAGLINLRGIFNPPIYTPPIYRYPVYAPQPVYVSPPPVVLQPVDCNDRRRYATKEERDACLEGQAERLREEQRKRVERARQEGRTGYIRR